MIMTEFKGVKMQNKLSRLILFSLFVMVVFSFQGCGKKQTAQSSFDAARQQMNELVEKKQVDNKQIEEVVGSYLKVVEKFPQSDEALASLDIVAGLYIKQNNFTGAIAHLSTLLGKMPEGDLRVADVHFKIAQLYELQKQWAEAEEIYWTIAEKYPTHVRGLYSPVRVVNYYASSKDPEGLNRTSQRAIQHYESMIEVVENMNAKVAFKNFLGVVYKVKGDSEKALVIWKDVYQNYAENPYAPLSILASAELVWSQGNIDKSEEMYLDYFKKYPEHSMAGKTAMNLGLIFHQKKKYEKARLWYQRALDGYFKNENSQQAELKLLIGKTYQEEVMWQEANAIYEEIESKYGSSIAAMQVPLLRGNYFKSQGDLNQSNKIFDQALNQYEEILKDAHHENNEQLAAYADRFRTQALMDKGAWDDVLLDIDKKIEREKNPEAKGKWAFTKASLVENHMNQPERALELYQQYLKKHPEHSLVARARKQMQLLTTLLETQKKAK
jgi:tetratricopeptide (TPR) repeat protein